MSRRCPSCGTSFPDHISYCGHDGTITLQEQDPSDVDRRIGKQLGKYLVVARVADGAMGRVYEGRNPDPQDRERVAIKVLHEHIMQEQVAVERFRREYETAAELDHPNIVKVHEFGETAVGYQSFFLTMEYLVGEELGRLLAREKAQPLGRVVRIVCQTALALDHAHSYGVIHRDLKPDNVFLVKTPEGDVVKLLDFGSVKLQMELGPKLTAYGTTLGSPYYMSPEQAMGLLDVDRRTDVFAMGAIAYEMIEGRVPFEGSAIAEILMKLVNEDPPPMQKAPESVEAVLRRAMAKDKTERPEGAMKLAEELIAAIGLSGTVAEWAGKPILATAEAVRAATPRPSTALVHDVPIKKAPRVSLDGFDERPRRSTASAPIRIELTPGMLLVGLALFTVLAVGGAVAAYFIFT